MRTDMPAHPGVIIERTRTVWDGRFPLQLVRFRQIRFDGAWSAPREWELWRRGRAAAVLPYDPALDCVLTVEQFRLPALAAGLDPVVIEVPAGLADGEESAEATVRREAQEEAGLALGRLARVGAFMLSPGGSDETCEMFVGEAHMPESDGEGLAGSYGLPAESEDIRVRVRPAEAAIASARAGKIVNGLTAIALLWLAAERPRLRREWAG